MSGAKYGHKPAPTLPHYVDVTGDLQQVEPAFPFPVSVVVGAPGAGAAASATQTAVDVISASSVEVKTAAEVTLSYIILTNNGATDCYYSLSGTVLAGDVSGANRGSILKANGGVVTIPTPGSLSIVLRTLAGTTVVGVGKVV